MPLLTRNWVVVLGEVCVVKRRSQMGYYGLLWVTMGYNGLQWASGIINNFIVAHLNS